MVSTISADRSLSRRSLLRSATAAGIAAAAGRVFLPNATRAVTAANDLPVSPEDQLAWFIDAVNSGGTGLNEAEIASHVAPGLLAVLPPAQLIGTMQALAAGYGAMTIEGATRPPTETQTVGLVNAAVGIQLALPVTVEAEAPHRITGLTVYPSPPGDGSPLLPVAISGSETTTPLVDVGGGRGMYYADIGNGGPTVVFEAGLGDSAATWSGIIPAIAGTTRVVSYDRANTVAGASDPVQALRTAADAVADLHTLLEQAAIPGPFVLVGHSAGGLFTRLYASHYPDEVAGLVLVDASHEDQDIRRQDMVSADLFAAEQQAIQGNLEGIDLETSFTQMRETRAESPLHAMPLVVLSAGLTEPDRFPAGWPMEAEAQLHDELQAELAGLVPGGRRIVAEQSGHYIQQSQPNLIVDAIMNVVQAVRDPSSW